MALKKTYIHYIYNIIKRNTQGLVIFLFLLRLFWIQDKKDKQQKQKVASRGKAGMKASSFLKIGVNVNLKNMSLKKTYIYYIYNIIKRNTQGLVQLTMSAFVLLETTIQGSRHRKLPEQE